MKKYEILAPVGANEQLKAAVRCGADAVYLGTQNFNARRNAENFGDFDLENAVSYCHSRGVKVYVTLNTLIFDRELSELYETVYGIAESNADAVIVQDFAAVKAVKDICPSLPLHASTQMAVHNVSGAKLLEDLGFSRIVLARELSFKEIKEIRENVSAELEVFVHGAHCMGASGNCYLSSCLGERSGNRGLCAQGCRLNWLSQYGREYALSLKDMSYIDSVNELKEIGIDSFKIEGRMKRPEYVAAAVTELIKALDGSSYNKELLRSVFSRNGFTDGYLKNARNLSMFGYRSKEDVTSATAVLKDLEKLYKEDIHPYPISISLKLENNKKSEMIISVQDENLSVFGDIPQKPINSPLREEIAERSVKKLGDTPFHLENFTFENNDNLTLSASSINALRREACKKAEEFLNKNNYIINKAETEDVTAYLPTESPEIRVRLQKYAQYSEELSKAEFIILPIDEILKNEESFIIPKEKVIAEMPPLLYNEAEKMLPQKLRKLKAIGINKGFCGNIGEIKLLTDNDFLAFGSHGLNITNTLSLNFYENMLQDTVLSFELSEKAIRNIGGNLKRGVYIYGYLPIMLMRSCPQKSENGCANCSGETFLTDRKNVKFPVLCHNKDFSVLHNSVPLYLGDIHISSIDFKVLYFTTETQKQCKEIFSTALKGEKLSGRKTTGIYKRDLL